MRLSFSKRIAIDAPPEAAWRVLAHEFAAIGAWSSVISHSEGLGAPEPGDAALGGRVCAVPGFGETNERLTYVDERSMRLGYSGTMRGAPFVKEAVNHWSVLPSGANACIVEARAYVEMAFIPWVLIAPFMYLGMRWLGQRTAEDLKYYVEHGAPHPRKLKSSPRQRPTPR